VLDDLRSYVQMASGLTEATASKAKDVVTALLSQGMSISSRAMPAPEMMGQVQELADDLVNTSRNNREMLVGMIRAEVDRAVGRMGFVREDELAALRRHVQRLENQLADLESASAATRTYPAQTYPAQPLVDATPEDTVAAPAMPEAPEPAVEPATDQLPVKKKKKIIVDESAGS
jgi:polyhydroxyalkanoate synthesis regulator phasin